MRDDDDDGRELDFVLLLSCFSIVLGELHLFLYLFLGVGLRFN